MQVGRAISYGNTGDLALRVREQRVTVQLENKTVEAIAKALSEAYRAEVWARLILRKSVCFL